MKASDLPLPAILARSFSTGGELAAALASDVAASLACAMAARGRATLAVSGGSTPKAFFASLSEADIDWSSVTITLVDERAVPPDHARSNHRLVASILLANNARAALFVPLWSEGPAGNALVARAEAALSTLPRPLDVVVLGMGLDGHTASFFPGGSNLVAALNPDSPAAVTSMEAQDAGEPRLTLTVPRLIEAGLLVLHIEGVEKQRVLDLALQPGPESDLPIRAVLRGAPKPVTVYWAP